MVMSDFVPKDEISCSGCSSEATAGCEYLAQGTAIRCCVGPHTPRRGLHEPHETADDKLLGISCAGDRGRVYLERLALCAR